MTDLMKRTGWTVDQAADAQLALADMTDQVALLESMAKRANKDLREWLAVIAAKGQTP